MPVTTCGVSPAGVPGTFSTLLSQSRRSSRLAVSSRVAGLTVRFLAVMCTKISSPELIRLSWGFDYVLDFDGYRIRLFLRRVRRVGLYVYAL